MKRLKVLAVLSAILMSASMLVSCDTAKQGSNIDSQIQSLVDDCFAALENGDYQKYASYYPDFYIDMYADFAIGYGYNDASAYFLETEYGYYASTVGSDFTIKATVNSIDEMSSDELETGETAIKQTYVVDSIDLQSGYVIEVTEVASGTNGSDEETYEMMVLEIENTLYLYNQYFEYLATMG